MTVTARDPGGLSARPWLPLGEAVVEVSDGVLRLINGRPGIAGRVNKAHTYPEGHGFRDPDNRIARYRRVDDFFSRHLGACR